MNPEARIRGKILESSLRPGVACEVSTDIGMIGLTNVQRKNFSIGEYVHVQYIQGELPIVEGIASNNTTELSNHESRSSE